ncbi:MAG: hypothetical protein PHD97_02940 [Bacteroidales bacterium]|nr:hypothetical protein [Bacteroidales bacterium]
MKKSLLIACVTLFFCIGNINAGSGPFSLKKGGGSSTYDKGSIIFDVYYGFPNLGTTVLRIGYGLEGSEDGYDKGTFGPVGFKVEYMLSEKMGVGLDINYATSQIQWHETYDVYNQATGLYVPTEYDYKVTNPKLGVLGRFYYHFVRKEKFDLYTSAAVGYRSFTLDLTTNDPDYIDENSISTVPVGYRIAIGTRVFFTKNIGMNFEFGIGGALFTGGLCVKI